MPENPLEVTPFVASRHHMAYLDADGDGSPDGFRKLLVWTLHDLPYPDSPATIGTFDPLGNREREAIERLGIIGERSEVIVHRIRGHASAEGQPDDNLALSQRRAEAVEDAIREIPQAHPDRDVRVSATAVVEGLGEGEPVVFAGEDDHPLNRRVEIELEVGRIVPDPVDPSDPPSTKWRIGYDQAFSFYRVLGAQIGFGTIERLHDVTGDSLDPPDKREFWYYAGGVGIELRGKLAGRAAQAREKLAAGQPLSRADKAALALEKQKKNLQRQIDRLFPERLSQAAKNFWQQTTEAFEALGPDEWAAKTPEQKSVAILEAMGLSSLVSHTFMDGYFETDEPRRMSEMDLSVQALFSASVAGQAGVGGSFAVTALLMYLFDPDTGDSGEWISTAIAEAAVDAGLVPGFGASVSANLSTLHFR